MRIPLVFLLTIPTFLVACRTSAPPEGEGVPSLPGRAFRVTGYGSAPGSSDRLEFAGTRIVRASDGASTPATDADMPNWPRLSSLVRGPCALRILNVNDCDIRVGLRDGSAGRDLLIPTGSAEEAELPSGRYSLYVQYGAQPGVLYEGPSVRLRGGETVLEILPPNSSAR